MSSTYTGNAAGSLVLQRYNNFRGVDFTSEVTNLYRSPDSLNMWKDYKTLGRAVETRLGSELQLSFNNSVYGLFFYTINNVDHWIIHVGTSLIDYNPATQTQTVLLSQGMNPKRSISFIMNNILFIMDGLHYYEYNGSILKEVVGTIPITSIARKPAGSGSQYQNVNLISDYRINYFWGDGTSTEYHLDSKEIDLVSEVYIVNEETGVPVLQEPSTYTVDDSKGIVTFNTAPYEPASADNVYITYKKDVNGYHDRINNCTLATIFDNRIFVSGNVDYPNAIWYSGESDPRYIPDLNYLLDGSDGAKIKGLAVGNEALWSFKEPSQENTTIYYHQPVEQVVDNETIGVVKGYPTINSTITTGCLATGTNFNDDIIFFSNRGMEGIQNSLDSEQVIGHRSTFVDRKLLNEPNYEDMILVEWEGYLLVIIDNKVYLADSRQKIGIDNHYEYEWFYWELDHNIASASVHNDVLYLCTEAESGVGRIYTLTDDSNNRQINSYWCTSLDDFNYPQMLKKTNKRGFKTDVTGTNITISARTDDGQFETVGTYTNNHGWITTKLKRKKWNKIQLKFSGSNFGIVESTLEAYIGNYVKRS